MENQNFDIFDALWSSPSTMIEEAYVISDKKIISKLKSMSNLEILDDESRSILMNAVIYERTSVVEYLLKKGVNVNYTDDNGFTALHFAVQTNNTGIIEMLLKSGANSNIKNKFGNNAILCADNDISIDALKLLLKHGSDPYQKNNYGVSAFDTFSCNPDHIKLIENRNEFLLENSGDTKVNCSFKKSTIKDKLKSFLK